MEKQKPHCPLSIVKSLVDQGKIRTTTSAINGARQLGINTVDAMAGVVMSLTVTDFFKSMTTHADHRVWQDVYHAKVNDVLVYVKLTVVDDVLIVSFKEL